MFSLFHAALSTRICPGEKALKATRKPFLFYLPLLSLPIFYEEK